MEHLVLYALSFIGGAYRWGGDDPVEGFDCSGFVQELLASVGMDPPGDQTAQGLFDHYERSSAWNQRVAGSLVFYGKSMKEITHIAMMINPYQVIEAGGGGSKTLSKADAASQNAFIRVRPLGHRKDQVAVLRPKYAAIGET